MDVWLAGRKYRETAKIDIYTHTVVYRHTSSGNTFSNIEELQHNYLHHSGYAQNVPLELLPDNITLPLLSLRTEAAHSLPIEQGPLLAQGPHHIISGCDL